MTILRPLPLLIGLAALLPGCATRQPARQPTGPHFSIMTYNVNYGMPGADRAIGAIRALAPDVVCLQEISPAWEEAIRNSLSAEYGHMKFRHSPGAGGMAVLSKVPLREVAYGRPDAGWFPAWVVVVDTPVGPVQALNVHLRPALSDRGSATPSAYFGTKEIRQQEVQTLHPLLDPAMPAIVLGDFNENDGGPALRWLEERSLTDALRQFDPHTPTWRWRVGLVTLKQRLDHLYYSHHLDCLDAGVVRVGASDHDPIVARFQAAARGVVLSPDVSSPIMPAQP
jgi:endonuclease/exonuclease/phosphatase family metal-dependent hydrolase